MCPTTSSTGKVTGPPRPLASHQPFTWLLLLAPKRENSSEALCQIDVDSEIWLRRTHSVISRWVLFGKRHRARSIEWVCRAGQMFVASVTAAEDGASILTAVSSHIQLLIGWEREIWCFLLMTTLVLEDWVSRNSGDLKSLCPPLMLVCF